MALQNDNQVTLDLLQNFNGLPSLKKLQAHLNFDREEARISRSEWTQIHRDRLADDPVITAAIGGGASELFGEEQSFKVIYCRLASSELLLTHEREVVGELLGHYPYALFVFSDQAQRRFHFLNVKDEPQGQKRRLFRRITVGNGERLRTAAEQLSKLDGEALKHLSLSEIQAKFDEAFDVGPVTKRFFAEYKRIFELVKAGVEGFPADKAGEEARNLFTQRLFNRLMFLAFIQKKGWLKYQGNADYLCTLWTVHQRDKFENKGSFYDGRLRPLFFLGLNTGPSEVNLIGINQGGGLRELIGDVPYLNGGLFEKDTDDDNLEIKVPDAGLDAVINDLFEKFNFTITESTPLDIEVAVDPEMLGKIFEELVTGRHESGSYYTPKPIVSFMCREALKGYIEAQVTSESQEAVARFVDRHEPEDLHDAEGVLNALRRVTVCDPACGSGAYLLGMLHELLDLRESLFKTKKLDHEKVYDRKLEIIQTNIYGVDIAEFAVNIARLRLWLSLAVDYGGSRPEPLPNLDYKIERGDSVCSPSPEPLQMGLQEHAIREMLQLKRQYLRSHHGDKRRLRQQIDEIRENVRQWSHRERTSFDWVVDFAEVFAHDGFDIVLANPPYIRQEDIKHLKVELKRRFAGAYSGMADLYTFFYLRGFEMLKEGGMLSYISSDKWLRAGYGSGLRETLGKIASLRSLTDFGELPVFETAATFPMILVARKAQASPEAMFLFTQVKTLRPPYPDVLRVIEASSSRLSSVAVAHREWHLVSAEKSKWIQKMDLAGLPLAEYVGGEIYYGIKTGLNEAFVLSSEDRDRLVKEDSRSSEVIVPMAKGDDVRKWHMRQKDRWLILAKIGIDMKRYPAIMKHLSQWKSELEKRADQGDHWWELRSCTYYHLFKKPRIIFPDLAKEPRFCFTEAEIYTPNTTYFIPTDDLFLLGVLNSKCMWDYAKEKLSVMGDAEEGGRLRFFTQFVRNLPVPHATDEEKQKITNAVRRCLSSKGSDVAEQENYIDQAVSSLFGVGR